MSLINRTACRERARRLMRDKRPALDERITAFSSLFFTELDIVVHNTIDRWVEEHPSIGKTFQPGSQVCRNPKKKPSPGR